MNLKEQLVLLDLLRDCINHDQVDHAISIIHEKQAKSGIGFSAILKNLNEKDTETAMTSINAIMKDVGMKLSKEKLMVTTPAL